MPNHVTTIFRLEGLSGDALSAAQDVFLQDVFLNDDRLVDFGRLVPMPACLRDFEPHSGIIERAKLALGLLAMPVPDAAGLDELTDRLEFFNAIRAATTHIVSDDIPAVCRAMSNYAECGYLYWYDWRNDNWGTKWGAYGQSDPWPQDATEFEFQTAWSHPKGLMLVLSQRVGDVKISVRYADEDTGSNCGEYVLRNGSAQSENIAPRYGDMAKAEKAKWTEFAFGVTHPGEDPRSHGYDENWVYREEIEDEDTK